MIQTFTSMWIGDCVNLLNLDWFDMSLNSSGSISFVTFSCNENERIVFLLWNNGIVCYGWIAISDLVLINECLYRFMFMFRYVFKKSKYVRT